MKKSGNIWMKFAVGEGVMKAISSVVMKLIGTRMGTVEMGCIAGIIVGLIQMTAGFVGFAQKRNSDATITLVPSIRAIMWAILFGFFASIPGTVWSIYTFTLGADMGIRTLLIVFSIVPGAIIGKIFWGDKLGIWQVLGILVFLVSIWAMLDFPLMFSLPGWFFATLVITFTQPVNEALSRCASDVKLDIWQNGFWIGNSTMFFCIIAFLIIAICKGGVVLNISNVFMIGSVITGVIVVFMISFKLLSYIGGGTIALKKLLMFGSYLIGATIAGIMIYDEPFTNGKIIGILLFFVAFGFTKEVWRR